MGEDARPCRELMPSDTEGTDDPCCPRQAQAKEMRERFGHYFAPERLHARCICQLQKVRISQLESCLSTGAWPRVGLEPCARSHALVRRSTTRAPEAAAHVPNGRNA